MLIVTGGAGFIGSCIVARLNEMGRDDIVIVDHLTGNDPKKRNIEHKKYVKYFDKTEFIKAVGNNRYTEKVEAVIHMGACSSTTLQDARYYEENNYVYSRDLAKWCLDRGVRLIYASSAATYGDGQQGYKDDEETARRLKPLNLYGRSKQKFDLWIYDNGYAGRVVGLKFFNVFGPNEYHKEDMRSVVAKAYQRVAGEGKIGLFKSYRDGYADGEQKRDFIYVKDAVRVVMYFLEHSAACGIYNVGTGQARTWNDLAAALFDAVGKKPCIEYIDMPKTLRDKYQYFTQADTGNLRAAGFRNNFTSLEKGVEDYVRYLKDESYL